MYDIKKMLISNINELNAALDVINEFLSSQIPEGVLYIDKRRANCHFSVRTTSAKNENFSVNYIRDDNRKIIESISKRDYYRRVKTKIEKELESSKRFLKKHDISAIYNAYEKLNKYKKEFVSPLIKTPAMNIKEKVKAWKELNYEVSTYMEEKLIFPTERGEYVRSKSEVFIADCLYRMKDYIDYRYEPRIRFEKNKITLLPDFDIICLRTGKRIFWEHFGLIDDEEYRNNMIEKMNCYRACGLRVGRDIIYTFETKKHPLTKNIINECISEILK